MTLSKELIKINSSSSTVSQQILNVLAVEWTYFEEDFIWSHGAITSCRKILSIFYHNIFTCSKFLQAELPYHSYYSKS